MPSLSDPSPGEVAQGSPRVTLFLCGDLMTGRGIDQILPHPSDPRLFEPYVRSAIEYVELAERASGKVDRPVEFAYVWGDALQVLDDVRPQARIVNLETAVTTSDDAWPRKGIHYRMHPGNLPCLTSARLDCCVLANNHVLDWGRRGLDETLETLAGAGIRTAGAGRNLAQASAPAVIETQGGYRVLVFGFALESSGVPPSWGATARRSGVNLLPDMSRRSVDGVARQIAAHRGDENIVIASLHWGANWGYGVSTQEREFAHALIDVAGVDLIHGHSSHHPRGIEVHRGKLILYGCGDLLNDYEGIGGHEDYRGELALMYFPTVSAVGGRHASLSMVATRTRHMRINRAAPEEIEWLRTTLNREGRLLGSSVVRGPGDTLQLEWR
jgi:poly-gamma-glutamate synthesis protein (capsule biosynthesis protein)